MCYCDPSNKLLICGLTCYGDALDKARMPPVARHDPIAEKLDEIADMAEWWRKHRDKGRMPSGIRAGMMVLCEEIAVLKQSKPSP